MTECHLNNTLTIYVTSCIFFLPVKEISKPRGSPLWAGGWRDLHSRRNAWFEIQDFSAFILPGEEEQKLHVVEVMRSGLQLEYFRISFCEDEWTHVIAGMVILFWSSDLTLLSFCRWGEMVLLCAVNKQLGQGWTMVPVVFASFNIRCSASINNLFLCARWIQELQRCCTLLWGNWPSWIRTA